VIDGVAEGAGEGAMDDVEGAALVVAFEVLDVLEDEGGGAVEVEDVAREKKRLPCFTSSKPWRRPRLSFFETPAMLKGWQGKPAQRMSCAGMSATATVWMSPCGFSPKFSAYVCWLHLS